jgi:hypothetical protein
VRQVKNLVDTEQSGEMRNTAMTDPIFWDSDQLQSKWKLPEQNLKNKIWLLIMMIITIYTLETLFQEYKRKYAA